jgi:hypothetical protein
MNRFSLFHNHKSPDDEGEAVLTMMLLLFFLFLTIQAAVSVRTSDSNSALRSNVVFRYSENVTTTVVETDIDAKVETADQFPRKQVEKGFSLLSHLGLRGSVNRRQTPNVLTLTLSTDTQSQYSS